MRLSKKNSSNFLPDITMREAVMVSVFFHIGILIGGVLFSSYPQLSGRPLDELKVELEVVAESEPLQPTAVDYSSLTEAAGGESDSENSGKFSLDGGAPQSKHELFTASFSSLSALRESFNFVAHQAISDSAGVFLPIEGTAPDTRALAEGLRNAIETGIRSGRIGIGAGGNCPAGGG